MNLKIVEKESLKANTYTLFYEKNNIVFSNQISTNGEKQIKNILKQIEKDIIEDLECVEIEGKPTFFINTKKERGLLPLDYLRMAAYRLAKKAIQKQISVVNITLNNATNEEFKAIAHGLYFASYNFNMYKSQKKDLFSTTFEIVTNKNLKNFKEIAEQVLIEQNAIKLTKDLVNTSGSDLTPNEFIQKIKAIAKSTPELNIKIRNVSKLKKEGYMGLVTVGKGSENPPYMVTITYNGKRNSKNHLALVGKGLTFDTGGLCLKPAKSMPEMISDMTGAATALSTIEAIAKLKLPIRVSAILCLAENRIGSCAMLPGDIFTAKNGKTIMVDNTDAEGRLVLTDGLCEAKLIHATHIVDIATLTGAMVRALGYAIAGLFSNNDELLLNIINCGESCCEKFWSMPLEEEYADALKDKFADLKNTGTDAGAISAALFLQEFIPENTAWAHLDIAGTAFVTKKWKYTEYGATGFGVQTLIELAREMSLQ